MKKLLFALLLLPTLAWGQAYSLFQPSNGVLKGSTSTFVTTAATSSDIISLWTGSCSSTTFLRGDGQCLSPGGAGIGTVTSVGLAWTGSGLTVSGSPVVSAGTLTFSGVLNVATGGIGVGTLTGLAKGNGTSAFSAAASSDVISLWTGSCSSTTFLRGDGSCQSVAGTTDASTLTTGTLADARLSANVVLENTANVFTSANQQISANDARYTVNDTAGGSNQKVGRLAHSANALRLDICNDAISSCNSAITVAHSGAGPTIDSVAIVGTAITANGNPVVTSTSGLNASNINSGTVPDARLSTNIPLKNVANTFINSNGTNFTNGGNIQFNVANSTTGYGVIALATNGIQRIDMCSSSLAVDCGTSTASNDSSIRFSQKLWLEDNSGATPVAVFDSAGIDLTATVVNANGSRINTAANSGRFSSGRVNGPTGILSNGFNVTSVTRTSVGNYTLDVSAAGLTAPNCTVTTMNSTSDGHASIQYGAGAILGVKMYNSGFSAADYDFSFICQGF